MAIHSAGAATRSPERSIRVIFARSKGGSAPGRWSFLPLRSTAFSISSSFKIALSAIREFPFISKALAISRFPIFAGREDSELWLLMKSRIASLEGKDFEPGALFGLFAM